MSEEIIDGQAELAVSFRINADIVLKRPVKQLPASRPPYIHR